MERRGYLGRMGGEELCPAPITFQRALLPTHTHTHRNMTPGLPLVFFHHQTGAKLRKGRGTDQNRFGEEKELVPHPQAGTGHKKYILRDTSRPLNTRGETDQLSVTLKEDWICLPFLKDSRSDSRGQLADLLCELQGYNKFPDASPTFHPDQTHWTWPDPIC